MRRVFMVTAAAALCTGALWADPPKKIYSNDYMDKVPPALVVDEGHTLNAEKAPVLEDLVGRVVWVEFSFLA